MTAPVLIYAGELDFTPTPQLAARAAGLFPRAEVIVQPGAGHMPWLDDPPWLAATIARFLGSPQPESPALTSAAGLFPYRPERGRAGPVWQNIGP